MQLQVADYIYLVAAAFFVIAGLFRGLSGFFAFVAALVASAALSFYFWPVICLKFGDVFLRSAVTAVGAILVFGIVRFVVKFVLRKIISQPSDSIVGMVFALVLSAAFLYVASSSPIVREYSSLASYLSHIGEKPQEQ